MLNVLWALGWAMMVLSALVHLPPPLVTAFGLVVIAWHNLLDPIQSSNPVWFILHSPNFILANPQHSVFVAYPLIPWVGVRAAGYGLGPIYAWASDRRRSFLLRAGLGLTAAFVILRGVNIYGDPVRWTTQKSAAFTVLSFLQQISAITVVPPDDARSGAAFALVGRRRDAAIPAARTDPWQSANVLLLIAYAAHFICSQSLYVMRATDRRAGCSSRQASVSSPSPRHRDGDSLCRLSICSGLRCTCALPALPLVCGLETTP